VRLLAQHASVDRPLSRAASPLVSDAVPVTREVMAGGRAARLALEQSAQGALRPFHYTAVGYLAVLFQDPEDALRAQRGLQQQGVPEGDLRRYDGEEILGIASRLQQERSILAKAINEVVVDHQLRERWLANARAGGAQLWVQAPTKDRANRLVGLLAACPYVLLRYLGEDGIETIEGRLG
jgi:hypothetical protein